MGTAVSLDRPHSRRTGEPGKVPFVYHPDFATSTPADFPAPPQGLYRTELDDPPISGEPQTDASLLKGLQQGRLLTAEGERYLFRRMNWLKYRAQVLSESLHPSRPSRKKRQQIDRLLHDADAARAQIAAANLRLVASIAGRLSNSVDEFHDCVAEGNLILLKAIDLFDFSRGYRFSTYATHAIQRRLYRLMSQRLKRSRRESTPGGDMFSVLAEPAPEADQTSRAELERVASHILASIDETLDEREQLIVRGRFGLDGTGKSKTFRHLAEQLGLSKERIRQLLQRAISKLAATWGHLASDLVA